MFLVKKIFSIFHLLDIKILSEVKKEALCQKSFLPSQEILTPGQTIYQLLTIGL